MTRRFVGELYCFHWQSSVACRLTAGRQARQASGQRSELLSHKAFDIHVYE